MKKIFGALLALTMTLGAFAGDLGLYGKLNAGWKDGTVHVKDGSWSDTTGFNGFEIFPAIGICPEATSFPDKPFDLTFEASLGVTFGSGSEWDEVKVTIVNPAVMCLFNWHFEDTDSEFLKHFVPYAGAGIATPIQFVKVTVPYWYNVHDSNGNYVETKKGSKDYSSTQVSFDMPIMAGARYAFTEQFEVNAEFGWNLFGTNSWFTRGGVMYRFK